MKKEMKDIGELLRDKLETPRAGVEDKVWAGLQGKLRKKKFFRFDFYEFNIYYLLFILGTFSLSAATFIDYFFLRDKVHTTAVIIQKDSTAGKIRADENNALTYQSTPSGKKEFISRKSIGPKYDSQSIQDASLSVPANSSGNNKAADSLTQEGLRQLMPFAVPDSAGAKRHTVEPMRKVVYIRQRDTVFVHDTLRKRMPLFKIKKK